MKALTLRVADAMIGADDRVIAIATVLSFIGSVASFYTLHRMRGTAP